MEKDALRILLISPLAPPAGGIASWSKEFLQWAQTNHVTVNVVNTALVGKRAERFNAERRLSDEIGRTKGILVGLKQEIAAHRPDIVHLNSPCGRFGIVRDYLCALAVRRKRIPLVVHYRCNIADQIGGSRLGMIFFKKLTDLADLILVLNTASKEYVKKTTGRESQRVANFIDAGYTTRRPKYISSKISSVLFVGHVQDTKGSREVIEAARLLPGIDFVLAGPISAKISSLRIPDNVRLLGSVNYDRVQELLDEADVFLFPSYTEGFSNALLEAMARGVPVIATPVGANADMIEESGGMLVRVGSVVDIVNAIDRMSPRKVRENMSLWNRAKAERNYSSDSVMHSLLRAYKEVVGSGVELG